MFQDVNDVSRENLSIFKNILECSIINEWCNKDGISDTWKEKAIQHSARQKDSLNEPLKSSSIAQ